MSKVTVVTGYKPFELGIFNQTEPAIYFIKKALQQKLITLIDEGLEWVIISGSLGVELWTAEVVFDLQSTYPQVKLAVITPFLNQEAKWNADNKELYEMVIAQADFVDALSKQSYVAPWQFRNKNTFFLHKSDSCIILYDREKEGAPKYFYEAAQVYKENNMYDIHTIDFYDLQLIVDEESELEMNDR